MDLFSIARQLQVCAERGPTAASREALAPHVPKLEYCGTMISSKYNAMGEVCMRIIEEMTKAVMLTTRLETELRPLATEYAVRMHNLTAKRIRTGPDGN